jgi:CBS domain-containing protein
MKILANVSQGEAGHLRLADLVGKEPVVAYPDEPLRFVVNRMAETRLTRFPVVKPGPERELLGMIAIDDLLKARELTIEEEQRRERVLRLRMPASLRWRGSEEKPSESEQEEEKVK